MVRAWGTIILVTLAALAFSGTAAAQSGDIDSYVDANHVRLGDSIEYIIDITQSVQQVIPPESSGFRVVGRSTRTNVRVINGSVERSISYRFRLTPTKVGTVATGAGRVRFQDGTIVRGASFDIEVLDGRQPGSSGSNTRQARSAPVRPQRTPSGSPTQGADMKRTAASNAGSDYLPPVAPAGSSDLFSSGIPADVGDGPFVISMLSDNTPYVGEQLIVDYLLFSPVTGFGMNAQGLTEPSFSNFWFDEVTEQRRNNSRTSMIGTERVRGRLYEVHLLRSFLLLPLDPGEAIVPPIELTVSDSSLFGRRGTRDIGSPPLQIDVQPLPEDGQPAGFKHGNVGRFSLSATVDAEDLKVGETARILVSLRGSGIASRVVAPDISLPDAVRRFPAEDDSSEAVSQQGWMELTHTRAVAFSPLQEATLQLPAISFSYFDPWSETYKTIEAEIPAVTVEGVREGFTRPQSADTDTSPPDAWLAGLPAERTLQPANGAFSRLDPFRGSPGYYGLLLAPFLLVLTTAGLRGARSRRQKGAPERRIERAGRVARKKIEALDPNDPESFSQMAQILRRYLGIKAQIPCQGATLKKVREIAGQHFGRTGFLLANVVEEAEHARFGGASSDDFESLRARAQTTIQAAEHAPNEGGSEA